jgi:hypothetical protein
MPTRGAAAAAPVHYARLRPWGFGCRPRGTVRGTTRRIIPAQLVPSVLLPVASVQLARVQPVSTLLVNGRSVVRSRSPAPGGGRGCLPGSRRDHRPRAGDRIRTAPRQPRTCSTAPGREPGLEIRDQADIERRTGYCRAGTAEHTGMVAEIRSRRRSRRPRTRPPAPGRDRRRSAMAAHPPPRSQAGSHPRTPSRELLPEQAETPAPERIHQVERAAWLDQLRARTDEAATRIVEQRAELTASRNTPRGSSGKPRPSPSLTCKPKQPRDRTRAVGAQATLALRAFTVWADRAETFRVHLAASCRARAVPSHASTSIAARELPAQEGVGSRSKYPPPLPPACTRYPDERSKPALPPTSDGS